VGLEGLSCSVNKWSYSADEFVKVMVRSVRVRPYIMGGNARESITVYHISGKINLTLVLRAVEPTS
jgi:hypothetical protein